MSQFDAVTLTFEGKDYTVTEQDSIWRLIEVVEDVITFLELLPMVAAQKYPATRIFRAYAEALTYAGCRVTPMQVREAADYSDLGNMAGALLSILSMTQPGRAGVDLEQGNADGEEVKKKATDEK